VFVSTYKFVLNALPILLPEPIPPRAIPRNRSRLHQLHSRFSSDAENVLQHSESAFADEEDEMELKLAAEQQTRNRSRHARLSMSAQAHQVWVRKKTRRWYSVFAGALAGALGILCEKKGRRTAIAQQMFVRCVLSIRDRHRNAVLTPVQRTARDI
jgi:hypothetical protein